MVTWPLGSGCRTTTRWSILAMGDQGVRGQVMKATIGAASSARGLGEGGEVDGGAAGGSGGPGEDVRRGEAAAAGGEGDVVADREPIGPRPAARGRGGDAEAIDAEPIRGGEG